MVNDTIMFSKLSVAPGQDEQLEVA